MLQIWTFPSFLTHLCETVLFIVIIITTLDHNNCIMLYRKNDSALLVNADTRKTRKTVFQHLRLSESCAISVTLDVLQYRSCFCASFFLLLMSCALSFVAGSRSQVHVVPLPVFFEQRTSARFVLILRSSFSNSHQNKYST